MIINSMIGSFEDRNSSYRGFLGKRGLTVIVYNNNINKAIGQLKKRCNSEGISKELRKRKNFETNTLKRRRALAEAQSRWRKKQQQINGLDGANRNPRRS